MTFQHRSMESRRTFLQKLFGFGAATVVGSQSELEAAQTGVNSGGVSWGKNITLEQSTAPYGLYNAPATYTTSKRTSTKFIVLHTTEGSGIGALQSLRTSKVGSANYLVAEDGKIYRIHPVDNTTAHAGLSRWNGIEGLNDDSVGIEVAGRHYYGVAGIRPSETGKNFTPEQIAALRWLIGVLKQKYGITDDCVITHSMIAYGKPNKYHDKCHRGRKPCGMTFALPQIRAALGLSARPQGDPEVQSGRFVVADKYLFTLLFAPREVPIYKLWDDTSYRDPRAELFVKNSVRAKPETLLEFGLSEASVTAKKVGFHKITQGQTAFKLVGKSYNLQTTIYLRKRDFGYGIITGDKMTEADFASLEVGSFILPGYVYGIILPNRSAYSYAKQYWDSPLALYIFPSGEDFTGDEVNAETIPPHTLVFYPK
jgi:N-acetylmuramoyl-L-alanine amidase